MSGINTLGLPLINTANAKSWPLPSTTLIPTDTGNLNGVTPESQAITPQQLIANRGAVSALTDTAGTTKVLTGDASTASDFSITLTTTGYTMTIANPAPGQECNLYITQDGSGSRTITTWTNVWFAGGTEPTLTATAAALDVINLRWNATLGKWIGIALLDAKA